MQRLWPAALLVLLGGAGGCDRAECRLDVECSRLAVCVAGRCRPPEDGSAPTDGDADGDSDRPDADRPDAEPDGDSTPYDPIAVIALGPPAIMGDAVCDLDEDGLTDNAFSVFDPLLLALGSELLGEVLNDDHWVVMLDVHRIPDPETPHGLDFVGRIVGTLDCDREPSDNGEPGEVLVPHPDVTTGLDDPGLEVTFSVDHGALTARGDQVVLFGAVHLREFQLTGVLSPGIDSFRGGVLCGYTVARELIGLRYHADPSYSLLDLFISPGEWLGIPDLPGAQPDIDLDGDGLELFLADETGHVIACIDGDGTAIPVTPERHCVEADEIADAISMTLGLEGVAATLLPIPEAHRACPEL